MKPIYFIIGAIILIAAAITGTLIPQFSYDWFGYLSLSTPYMLGSVFGCAVPSPRSCDTCPEDELNKIVHVAFVKKGTAIDKSTPALFTSTLLAAALACNAYIIRNVSGSKAKPSTKEGKGRGKQIKRILAKEHSIDAIDFDYIRNIAFWNSIEDSAINYDLYYFTDTYGWVVTSTQITVAASDTITDDNTTYIEGSFTVTWAQRGNPLAYKADVDGLAACQELFTYSGPFVNASSSTAVIVGNNISVVHAAALSASYNAGVALDSASITSVDQLPTGITLSASGQVITLSGSTAVVGTRNLTVKAQNACGISTDFNLTLIVT